MLYLKIENLYKKFNDTLVINNISFNINQGEIISLLGASGSGKTTLLRIIAGLAPIYKGKIIFNGHDLRNIAPHKRNFGMMFQEFALFPHKNVFDNIAFGLEIKKYSPKLIKYRVEEILELIGLEGFAQRSVADLSGGERQRVALARSLAPRPKLLMLDEPLGSLDRALREKLLGDLAAILKKLEMTTIFVTHDQNEAFAVSDRIIVLRSGKIEQVDTPEKIYNKPANAYVARFLGFKNIIDGIIDKKGEIITSSGIKFCNYKKYSISEGTVSCDNKITLMIRSDRATLVSNNTKETEGVILIYGNISSRIFQGKYYKIGVKLDSDITLYFDIDNVIQPPDKGDYVVVAVKKNGGVVQLM